MNLNMYFKNLETYRFFSSKFGFRKKKHALSFDPIHLKKNHNVAYRVIC